MDEKALYEILKDNYNTVKNNTIKNIITSYKRISRNCFGVDLLDGEQFKEYDKITSYLNSLENLSVKKVLLSSLIKAGEALGYSNDLIKLYNKYLKLTQIEEKDSREYMEASEKEKNNYISWDDVISTREELKKNIYKSEYHYMRYILLCVYSYMPPLRVQDWASTAIYQDKKDIKETPSTNYIILNDGVLFIIDSKTGPRIVDIPEELTKILYKYYNYVKPSYIIYSFKSKDKPTTPNSLTHILNNIFNKKISSTMLRKIFISHIIDSQQKATQRKTIARTMGHSIHMQNSNYSKFSRLLH